jgi:hypothetical protein
MLKVEISKLIHITCSGFDYSSISYVSCGETLLKVETYALEL